VCALNAEKFEQLENTLRQCGLKVRGRRQVKLGANMVCTWETTGRPRHHERLMQQLIADPEVKEFKF
jgi:hypothetical protein